MSWKRKSRPQKRKGGTHTCAPEALEQVTVGHDDPVEIPLEDRFDRLKGSTAVGNHASDQAMWPKAPGGAGKQVEHACLSGLFRGQVEDQIGKNHATGQRMEEDHLVKQRCAKEEMLFNLARPLSRS